MSVIKQKQKEAIQRQEKHNKLTIDQKIQKAERRTGNSTKEINRLLELKKPKQKEPKKTT